MEDQQSPRVVSLIASATEIVCALGGRDLLVGRSHECDYPHDVLALPGLTEPKFALDGTSYQIDERVKAILQEGTSVYRVSAEALKALKPDVIVTQDQCEVCAVSLRDVEAAICDWVGAGVTIVSLKPDRLDDIWSDIRRTGAAIKREGSADRLVDALQGRMRLASEKAKAARAELSVACIEWVEPLMAAGNWMPELVELAGARNVFGEAGKHSPWLEWDAVRAADPDVILVMPCGYDLPRTLEDTALLRDKPGYREMKAVKNGRVYAADGNQYFNRPGPRIADSLEILCEILHPDIFGTAGENSSWQGVP